MFFSDEFINEVRDRNDIVDVISSYVKIEKRGANYMGCCPFHNEKTPSFSVSQNKQIFHCFGCGEGGNVISFIMKHENVSFSEAVVILANRAGIKVDNENKSNSLKDKIRLQIFEANIWTTKFFVKNLLDELNKNPEGDIARYIKKRGLNKEIIKKFAIGYSKDSFYSLYNFLKSKDYKDDVLSKTGLFKYNAKGAYDIFRKRLIFPIVDTRNKVIGFGGRVLDDSMPKYLNSPETPVFDKSKNLYGLNYAKSSKRPYIILCEGYMDVISLFMYGFDCAVAALGTAFNAKHSIILKRYTKNVYLSFDSDSAGIKAAMRAVPMLVEAGINVKILDLSPYKDPDELLKNSGSDELEKRISQAKGYFFWQIDLLKKEYDMEEPSQLTEFQKELALRLSKFTDKLERENYVAAVAKEYNINFEDLNKLVNNIGNENLLKNNNYENKKVQYASDSKTKSESNIENLQKVLISYLVENELYFNLIKKYVDYSEFIGDKYRKLYKNVCERFDAKGLSILYDKADEEDAEYIKEIISINCKEENIDINNDDYIRSLNTIANMIINFKKLCIEKEIEGNDDLRAVSELMKKKFELNELDKDMKKYILYLSKTGEL